MANKKLVEKGVHVHLWLDESMVKRIDELANKVELSRSRLVRNLIESGLEDTEVLDMVGILGLVKKYESFRRHMQGIGSENTAALES